MEHKPGKIYQAIVDVMKKVGYIGKDKKPKSGPQFNYRGIDDLYNHLQPTMAKVGIFSAPEILAESREERKSQSGGIKIWTILTVKYTFYATDGSSISLSVKGEAMDSGDKGCNKAMAIADKYACFQLFKIPTKEMIDPDSENHEIKTKQAPGNPPPTAPHEPVPPKKELKPIDSEELMLIAADIAQKMTAADSLPHLENVKKKHLSLLMTYQNYEVHIPSLKKDYETAKAKLKKAFAEKKRAEEETQAPGLNSTETDEYLGEGAPPIMGERENA